jgi:hypothetical protein
MQTAAFRIRGEVTERRIVAQTGREAFQRASEPHQITGRPDMLGENSSARSRQNDS